MSSEKPQAVHRKDYCPPDYWIERADLSFDLGEDETRVRARLKIRRREELSGDIPPLVLDGEQLECLGVWLDGEALPAHGYQAGEEGLRIDAPPAQFE